MTEEKQLEQYVRQKAKELGGRAYKLIEFRRGAFPDRSIFLPGGRMGILEVKGTGNSPTPRQAQRLVELRSMGFLADWADTKKKVDAFFELILALPESPLFANGASPPLLSSRSDV